MKKGFTLIELMIVVIIIGVLAAVAVPNYLQQQWKIKAGACKQNQKVIYDSILLLLNESPTPSTAQINAEIVGSDIPDCPALGTYSWQINATSITIICTGNEGPIVHGKFDGQTFYDGSAKGWNSN